MDKGREEFEKRAKNMSYDLTWEDDHYKNVHTLELFLGYQMCQADKSRDKEIHRLEQIATENSDWFDALKIDFDKQKEEIRALREVLSDTMEYMFSGEVGARKQGTCFSDIIDRARQFLNTNSSENRVDSDFRL